MQMQVKKTKLFGKYPIGFHTKELVVHDEIWVANVVDDGIDL